MDSEATGRPGRTDSDLRLGDPPDSVPRSCRAGGTLVGDMESPEVWRWVWLVAAVAFAGGEIAVAGSFFLLPFAFGAVVACVLAFLDVDVAWQWLAFVGVSAVSLLALFPLRRRLDREEPQDGIGARRLLGQPATVL